ncbi:MAG: SDR family oxidoreductase [Myxococcota bacterium]
MTLRFADNSWALILGGSSGFGLASARGLAARGMNVAIVHRDRASALPAFERELAEMRRTARVVSFNLDALGAGEQRSVLDELERRLAPTERIRLLLHSIAWGNLRPLLGDTPEAPVLDDEDFARTIFAMGTSLLGWTREVSNRKLFESDARVIGLTSEGSCRVWPAYAAVSTAKAALEALSRAIAVEFAPRGIRSNVIWAGVADTPALRKIPGGSELAQRKARENPLGRLTTPDDVADVVCLLCTDEARWLNGSIVRVDGGEHLVA